MWFCRIAETWLDPLDHCILIYDDNGMYAWTAIGHEECSPYGVYWTKEKK